MSTDYETQDGFILKLQRNDCTTQNVHHIDEQQFQDWQKRWDSKEAVIDHLLEELEKSMAQASLIDSPVVAELPN